MNFWFTNELSRAVFKYDFRSRGRKKNDFFHCNDFRWSNACFDYVLLSLVISRFSRWYLFWLTSYYECITYWFFFGPFPSSWSMIDWTLWNYEWRKCYAINWQKRTTQNKKTGAGEKENRRMWKKETNAKRSEAFISQLWLIDLTPQLIKTTEWDESKRKSGEGKKLAAVLVSMKRISM